MKVKNYLVTVQCVEYFALEQIEYFQSGVIRSCKQVVATRME